MGLIRVLGRESAVIENDTRSLIQESKTLLNQIDMLERWKSNKEGLATLDKWRLRLISKYSFLYKRKLEARKDDSPWPFCDDSWPDYGPDFYHDEFVWTELFKIFKRRMSAVMGGLKMATHADTGAAQNVVSSELAGTRELKRGLSGTIDGLKVSALADTGAAQNVVSGNFARARKLDVAGSPSSFRQGNSKLAHSLGTVNVRWAFADKPEEIVEIVCHVISNCAYDVILGRRFLSMTETFTRYRHRLTNCLSSAAGVLRINLLDESHHSLKGTLGDRLQTDAVPDTGAEGNVMDLRYAEEHGFNIRRGAEHRRMLEFADGSRQRAVGQNETSWTFASGLRIPLVFEVLEDCLHDVILGEEVLWEYNVFETFAASIQTLPSDTESFDLAPFSFVPEWVQKISGVIKPNRERKGRSTEPIDLNALETEERQRRDIWNHQHNFNWRNASEEERAAERERRRQYEGRLALARLTLEGERSSASDSHAQSIPSIPTAPNTAH